MAAETMTRSTRDARSAAAGRRHSVAGPAVRWLCLTVVLGALVPAAGATARARPFGFGSALVGSAPVGIGPSELAVDPATHTIYVANGYNDNGPNGPNTAGDTVSVIDSRRCDARDVSSCKGPWPTIKVGKLPAGITVDQQTDTVYVASVAGDCVSVFNGATCNAIDTSRLRGTSPPAVPVGLGPLGVYADSAQSTPSMSRTSARRAPAETPATARRSR